MAASIKGNKEFFALGGVKQLENRVSDFHPFMPNGLTDKNCLDVGCAEGDMIDFYLKDKFVSIDGVETSQELYPVAKRRFTEDENINIIQGDIRFVDLDKSYDYVFLLGVLHFFHNEKDREDVLAKVMSVTRSYLFVRTKFKENKLVRGDDPSPHKATSLKTIFKLAN